MPGTRSQGTPLHPLVPEIDRHYHQLRRENLSAIGMTDINENTPPMNNDDNRQPPAVIPNII